VVDQLALEYAGQPVVFLEYDVDDAPYTRYGRWWQAAGVSTATLPFVMVDSGNQFSNGYEDFAAVYRAMVEAAMSRPAQVDITAYWWRDGDRVRIRVHVTNLAGDSLQQAVLHAIVFEETQVKLTNRFVRQAIDREMEELTPGDTSVYTLETPELVDVDWDRLHYIVLVDHRAPGATGAYDTLQAVYALASIEGEPLPEVVHLPLVARQ
jgi:hypothetical protein